MADCHLVAYRHAGFQPIAICSRTRERAEQAAQRHHIDSVYADYHQLCADDRIEVLDIAVPPDVQIEVIREAVRHAHHIRGILAQKPLGMNYAQAREIVALCRDAGITLAVNQNMRYDQSVRACRSLLARRLLGEPVLATIDMRAIPHWMPWQQRLGWLTLRIMSIHHLDMFRFWFGDPDRVFASVRTDPRTSARFEHHDGICLYILEYKNGLRAAAWDDVWTGPAREGAAADIGIRWRVEGTTGLARGTIGWPNYPERTPSTLDWSTSEDAGRWHQPRWSDVWFPDAFAGPMAELLCAVQERREPEISGADNLHTMALVEACYLSTREHRAVEPDEVLQRA
jgi:predicted dehydrogenase